MTAIELRLARGFALPLDAVTRRMAILGMSGSGKSNVAVVLAEQMFAAGLPWVAIDPKGDWWGVRPVAPPPTPPRAQPPAAEPPEGVARPGKAERAILTALAQSGPIPLARVALLAGYVEDGGGFRNAVGRCRTMGWITGGRGEEPEVTPAGIAVLGPYEPLPTGPAVLDYWCAHSRMLAPSRALLRLLADAGGAAVDCSDAAVALGYAPDGGGWRNGVGRLRSLGLAEGPNSALRLSAAMAEAVA